MDMRLSKVILELYRGSREWPVAEFQDRALETVQSVIQFDSAMWGSGANDPHVIHNVHLFRQPQAMMDNYMRFQEQDFLRAAVCAKPGVTVNLSDIVSREELVSTEMYREHARHYGIECVLCTALIDPVSQLISFISFWRSNPKRPFRERDRLAKQFLMPHLLESYRANRLRHLSEAYDGATPARYGMCVCDKMGILHQAEDRCVSLLRTEWPTWGSAQLPGELRQLVGREGKMVFRGRTIVAEIAPSQDLFLLRLRKKERLDMLTEREHSIALQFARGQTHKEVAETLGISPATVRNHINTVYKKLGVCTKGELSTHLAGRQQ
jgi:DNA-binding CsgD family transcriptional regulator